MKPAEREELYFGTPVSDLCREELWKYEENPLDIWDKLLAHANENKAPAPDDLFRFKFHGLFYVAPAQDSFMLRLRVPGSILTAHQMRGIGGNGGGMGLRAASISPPAAICRSASSSPKTLSVCSTRCRRSGMTSRGSGADNIRNITASPITGHRSEELLRRRAARRGAEHLHSEFARHVRPAAQIQRRLR